MSENTIFLRCRCYRFLRICMFFLRLCLIVALVWYFRITTGIGGVEQVLTSWVSGLRTILFGSSVVANGTPTATTLGVSVAPPNSFSWDWGVMQIGRELGPGKNGYVKEVTFSNKDGKFALKTIPKQFLSRFRPPKSSCVLTLPEIALQREADHRNVVKWLAATEDRYNVFIVTELCTGGTLYEALLKLPERRFNEVQTKQLAWEIGQGIKHMHDLKIIHRDLSMTNIYLTAEGVAKIGDFGLAEKVTENVQLMNVVGTGPHMAPEVWSDVLCSSFPADVWAYGVIIYALLEGGFPFDSKRSIIRGNFGFIFTGSDSAMNLIRHMLVVNPDNRYTIDEVLAHPWFDEMRY